MMPGRTYSKMKTKNTTTAAAIEITAPVLPVSVAASYDLLDALTDGGCKAPKDFTLVGMPGGYGDCVILHSRKAFNLWDALPKTHPDKCANGYGAGTGMYIRD